MDNRKVPVAITYRAHDIQPPLFVAGTFSDPQWVPHEMECAAGSDGDNIFTLKLEVEPESRLQYKFRVGHGDWWKLNEDAPTVTDDAGNSNNLLEAPSLQDADTTRDETPEDNTPEDNTPEGITTEDIITKDIITEDITNENKPTENKTTDDIITEDITNENNTTEDNITEDITNENNTTEDNTPDGITEDPTTEDIITEDITNENNTTEDITTEEPTTEDITTKDITTEDTTTENNTTEDITTEEPTTEDTTTKDIITEDITTEDPTMHDANDLGQQLQPVPRVEALKQSDKVDRSATSTPEFARTAAEVADSAALVDPATPEPEVSDEVAAEVGYRQMTSTPPEEAADTAAEVADAAEVLDTDEAGVPVESAPTAYRTLPDVKDDTKNDSLDIAGFSNDLDPVPLFAHECAGLYEDDEIPGAVDVDGPSEILNGSHGNTEEDFGDPTLERFPSTRDEIITTVRKVESGLEVDQTAFEGTPPSPVVRSGNPSSADVLGECQSPEESPKSARGTQRLSLPRGSMSERSASAASLGSIAEGAEEEEADQDAIEEEDAAEAGAENSKADDIAPVAEQAETAEEAIGAAKKAEGEIALAPTKPALRPVVTVPSPSVQPSNSLLTPVSDEDEAIVLKTGKEKEKITETEKSEYLTPKRAATPQPEEPGSPGEPAPNAAAPVAEDIVDTTASIAEAEPAIPMPPSPRIVVSKAEDTPPEEELPQAASASSEDGQQDTETPSSTNENTGTESLTETGATSSGVEDSQPGSLRKRSAPQPSPIDRTGTPGSITETGREAAKSGNWFTAFFRLIFVDWVGGFVSRLCGGQRKT